MKKILSTIATVAMLAGATVFVRADGTNAANGSATAKLKPYPLNYCLVSGDKLGEMGDPAVTNYHGQEIKFCCPDCIKDFKKDPDKFMKKLAEAVKAGKLKKD